MRAGGAAATLLRKSPMLTNASSSMFDCMLGDLTEGKLRVHEWWSNVQLQTGDDQYDISYQSGSCSSVASLVVGDILNVSRRFPTGSSRLITDHRWTLQNSPSSNTFYLHCCFHVVDVFLLRYCAFSYLEWLIFFSCSSSSPGPLRQSWREDPHR